MCSFHHLFLLLLQNQSNNKQFTLSIPRLLLNGVLEDTSVHLQMSIHGLAHPGLGLQFLWLWGGAVNTMINGCTMF